MSDDLGFQIEVVPTGLGGIRPEGVEDLVIEATERTLRNISAVIEKSGAVLLPKFPKDAPKPSEVTVEFGVDAQGEAGVPLVTKGSIGANFKVSIKWKLT